MEKKDRPYSVVFYNKAWAEKYKKEKKLIASIFGEKALRIEHVGSTSVEGMWAKPQIDILVMVNNLRVVDRLVIQMELKGYVYQDTFNKYDERYFTRDAPSGERLISIHVVQRNNPKALSLIYLRDYLRKHSHERELYSQVKKDAYKSGVNRAEYPDKKKRGIRWVIGTIKKMGRRKSN